MVRKLLIALVLLNILFLLSIVSAGSRCNADRSWCCDNSNYVICESGGDRCQTQDWCDRWVSGDPSCLVSGNTCCPSEWVIDYNAITCCPINAPFKVGDNACNSFDVNSIADNYYTRLSDCQKICKDENNPNCFPEKCEGKDNIKCTKVGTWIYNFENKGKVVGKCDVE